MFKCDYHTHTYFSFDGDVNASPEKLCIAAIERGVTDLAITDHFECNWRAEKAYAPYKADEAYEAISLVKEKYKGKLNLTYGIEIGQSYQYPDEAKALLDAHKFDFVIGSIHNLRGAIDFYYVDFATVFRDMQHTYIGYLFERYLEETSEMIDVLNPDSVAHLTYLKRYCALSGHDYDFTQHFPKAEELFRKMIKKDIALELNVSTIWKALGFAMPDRDFLSLYRDCGGRLITVGTDAHSAEHIGDGVDEGFKILKSVGLNSVLVVRDGEKTEIKI